MYGCEIDYYDLDALKQMKTNMDTAIDSIRYENNKKIKMLLVPSLSLKTFHVVTKELIQSFEEEGRSYIRLLLNNGDALKTLYWMNDRIEMFNKMEIDYINFMLMNNKRRVLLEIENIAKDFFPKESLNFKITCLYLLYFFALLVNRDATWILIDYLNYGNKHHQYFINNNQVESVRESACQRLNQ